MAAKTPDSFALVSPEGYNYIIRGKATAALKAGDPAVITSTVPPFGVDCYIEKATSGEIDGLVLSDCVANGPVEVVVRGECDGYSGLTPKSYLSVAAGKLDSTAPGAGVAKQIKCISDHRIAVNCMFGAPASA